MLQIASKVDVIMKMNATSLNELNWKIKQKRRIETTGNIDDQNEENEKYCNNLPFYAMFRGKLKCCEVFC